MTSAHFLVSACIRARISGAEVFDLDAGCCGMAGSFGYEREHYEVSRLVGEQRLFPALRQAAPEDVIVAPGFSCRLQIQHFTGRTAVHPAQLLQSLLADNSYLMGLPAVIGAPVLTWNYWWVNNSSGNQCADWRFTAPVTSAWRSIQAGR